MNLTRRRFVADMVVGAVGIALTMLGLSVFGSRRKAATAFADGSFNARAEKCAGLPEFITSEHIPSMSDEDKAALIQAFIDAEPGVGIVLGRDGWARRLIYAERLTV